MGYTRIGLVFLASKARGIATTLISQMVRRQGVEPWCQPWRGWILPLNYRRMELSRCDSHARHLLQRQVGLTATLRDYYDWSLHYRSSFLFSPVNPYISCTFYAAGRIRTCVFIAEEEVSNLSPLTIWLLRHTPQTGIEPASPARRSSFQDYRLTIRLLWHLGGVPMVVSPQGQYDSIWVPDKVRQKDLHLQLSLFTKHSVCIHRFLSQRPL